MTYRKKLIEVALPLEEINKQSSREKSIRHGHPSTLHLWWARRPLAACRAVLFSSLVDDPGEYLPEKEAEVERQRLHRLIEQLVNWDNINNETLLAQARLEIARSVARNLNVEVPIGEAAIREFLVEKAPPVLDPFAGGGSIPLEAQRLGLRAFAGDLNPVAVLINKALIEIPPTFANRPPVHPVEKSGQASFSREWRGATGLAEDVRYYGKWMRDEAEKRIGHLYPKVTLPKEYGGGEATVIAWLWARTVKCPNPACGATMPLVRSFWLSTKKSKKAWVKPIVDRNTKTVGFEVNTGEGEPPDGTVNRRGTKCIVCETSVPFTHVRTEGQAHRMSEQLMAIVIQGQRGRIYLSPFDEHVDIAEKAKPWWKPDCELPKKHRNFQTPAYGMPNVGDLFTPRQLVALTTFSDLVSEAREQVRFDAVTAGLADDGMLLNDGGSGAQAYADAVATYLGLVVSRSANTLCSLAIWSQSRDQSINVFSRQALPMNWDFPEVNPFAGAAGDLAETAESLSKSLQTVPCTNKAFVNQMNASNRNNAFKEVIVATDPPYYDNIGYADLSDFFYVWLRRSLSTVYPDLLSTVLVPKAEELVATPYRFDGSKEKAQRFFEEGLGQAFVRMREVQHPKYPLTVYYAFKQSEPDEDIEESENGESNIASTGWETMLEGLLKAGFSVTGTWPMRTERPTGVKVATNALASSIVLVCRSRSENASAATRRELLAALKRELPLALKQLQQGAIAPVDLAQATIGPGMAVFSRYSQVLEADGSPMRVRTALALINQALDEFLAEQEGEFDGDTRWALAWFEQHGHEEGPFGEAETLSRAKNTSINGLVRAGVLEARAGKVRLLKRGELDSSWTPESDTRPTVWEATQFLIRELDNNGEEAAANLLRRLQNNSAATRDLAYRLYSICERKAWAQEALAYNMLASVWPRLVELAGRSEKGKQEALL